MCGQLTLSLIYFVCANMKPGEEINEYQWHDGYECGVWLVSSLTRQSH